MVPPSATLCGAASFRGLRWGVLPPSVHTTTTGRAFPQVQRRFLGNEARGPDFDPLDAKSWKLRPHLEVLCRSLSRTALSYNEFKQLCESLRLILFIGGSTALATDLLLFHPTRSAYWRVFSPHKWPGLLFSPFRSAKGSHGVFDFEQEALTKDRDGRVKTFAYATFGKTMG